MSSKSVVANSLLQPHPRGMHGRRVSLPPSLLFSAPGRGLQRPCHRDLSAVQGSLFSGYAELVRVQRNLLLATVGSHSAVKCQPAVKKSALTEEE